MLFGTIYVSMSYVTAFSPARHALCLNAIYLVCVFADYWRMHAYFYVLFRIYPCNGGLSEVNTLEHIHITGVE